MCSRPAPRCGVFYPVLDSRPSSPKQQSASIWQALSNSEPLWGDSPPPGIHNDFYSITLMAQSLPPQAVPGSLPPCWNPQKHMCLRDSQISMVLVDEPSCQVYFKWLLSLNHTGPGESNLSLVLIGKIFNVQHGPALMDQNGGQPQTTKFWCLRLEDEPCLQPPLALPSLFSFGSWIRFLTLHSHHFQILCSLL